MKIIRIVFLLLLPLWGSTQIISNQKPKKKPDTASDTSSLGIYFHFGYGSSYRVLKPSKTDFSKELGARADETPLNVSSYQFGVNSKISKTMSWEFGLQWLQLGEQYKQRFEDSLSSYQSKYAYFAVPLRIQFKYGNKLSFFCATGIQAQFLSLYRQEIKIEVAGKSTESTEKTLKNANSFHLASTSSLGLRYRLKNNLEILLGAECVFQLSNTFNKQSPYTHNPYSIQGKLGIQWNW